MSFSHLVVISDFILEMFILIVDETLPFDIGI